MRRPETPARPQSARLTCPKCGAWVETYLPVCRVRCLRCNRDFVPAGRPAARTARGAHHEQA